MSTPLHHELSAIYGAPKGLIPVILYALCLGSNLLVMATAHTSAAVLNLLTLMWIVGAFPLVFGAATSMDQFVKSARELRLPDHRPMMVRHYALLLTLVVVIPIVLLRIFIPDGWPLIWIILGTPLGLLWPKLAQLVRSGTPSRARVHTKTRHYPIRSPSDAIRVYYGNAFAPVPMASRVFKLRIFGAVLWSLPLILAEADFARPVRWLVPFYLGLTGSLAWVWLMTGLARFNFGRRAAFAELALLPGLGNPKSQRRAFYFAALTRPMCLCAFFSVIAVMWEWSTTHALRPVVQLGIALIFFMLFGGGNIIGHLLLQRTPRAPPAKQAYQLSMPIYIVFSLMYSASVLAEKRTPTSFIFIFYSCLLLLAAFQLIWTARYVRRLAERPHPFLQ
jgi:hypothetical protein